MIETRRIANNCADVGFCRINGAVQCKQHKIARASDRTLLVFGKAFNANNGTPFFVLNRNHNAGPIGAAVSATANRCGEIAHKG